MTSCFNVGYGMHSVHGDIGVRVGMLLGRYLDDPALVGTVAEHVVRCWFKGQRQLADASISTVEQWWNVYVEIVEAAAGGVDYAAEDDLRRVWAAHARRLRQQRMADPAALGASLIEPATADGGR